MIPASHHGSWKGTNRLWLEPGKPVDVSAATLTVKSSSELAYTWAFQGAPKDGTLALSGPSPACKGLFADTFHAQTPMTFHGHVRGAGLVMYGTYGAGEGPDWGWRIELDWADPDGLAVRMFNVFPSGEEAIAVDLRCVRA